VDPVGEGAVHRMGEIVVGRGLAPELCEEGVLVAAGPAADVLTEPERREAPISAGHVRTWANISSSSSSDSSRGNRKRTMCWMRSAILSPCVTIEVNSFVAPHDSLR
jgi:hypothetical protein